MTLCFFLVQGHRDDNLVFELRTIVLVFSFYVLSSLAMYLEQRECLTVILPQNVSENRFECTMHNKLTRHCENTKMSKKGLPLSERLEYSERR